MSSGNKEYGGYFGRYPAIVQSYDASTRQCRVKIPGITEGGEGYPIAEIEYPIGDKSRAGSNSTEIEITAGDTVWVTFFAGDPRYPIITGYRNPNSGNSSGCRRYHHAEIELDGDSTITLKVGSSTIEIKDGTITLTAASIVLNGAITGGGESGAAATFTGSITASQDIKAGSISLQTHTHSGVETGGGSTGAPQ